MGETGKDDSVNQRKYTRLRTVLPIDFTVVNVAGDITPGVDQERGSTNNVNRGGLALESSALSESTIRYLKDQDVTLKLVIHMPPGQEPIKAAGNVSWYKKLNASDKSYSMGVEFSSISSSNLNRIMKHALWRKYFTQGFFIMSVVVLILILARTIQ